MGDPTPPQNLSHLVHRRLIGFLGLLLPFLLYLLAGVRRTEGLEPWALLDSVSSYYYTGAVAVFTGVLLALSLFLFSYRGYRGAVADRVLGFIGGTAAVLVALFPTGAPGSLSEPEWWSPVAGKVHYVAAVVLFISFILFSLWLFRKTDAAGRAARSPGKKARDAVCLWCGVVMVVSVAWAGSAIFTGADILIPEVIALWAFAISWLAKGKIHRPVLRAVHRLRQGATAP